MGTFCYVLSTVASNSCLDIPNFEDMDNALDSCGISGTFMIKIP